jgi:ketosteroid isomerase-like protein
MSTPSALLRCQTPVITLGSMSEEANRLAAVQRGTEAFNRRDAEGMIEELDAEIEWTDALLQVLLGGEEQTYRGHEGVRDLMRQQDQLFSEFSTEYSEVRQRGDKIVAVGIWRTRGRSSGVPMETPVATLIEFKGAKAIRLRTYLDPDEGLEAAGLSK